MARASIILLICLAIVFSTASARGQATPKWSEGNAVPPPLFLSPLLSNPSYARQLSLVKSSDIHVISWIQLNQSAASGRLVVSSTLADLCRGNLELDFPPLFENSFLR